MKRIIALILTVAMLLGVMGTTAFAAEAKTTPEIPGINASVSSDGTVTVKLDGGKTDYPSAYAYVYTKDGPGSRYVKLEYDKSKKAYVGKNEDVAGGTMSSAYFYLTDGTTKTSDDGRISVTKNQYYNYSYNRTSGKLSRATFYDNATTRTRNKDMVLIKRLEEYNNYNYDKDLDYNGQSGSVYTYSYDKDGVQTGYDYEHNAFNWEGVQTSETKSSTEYSVDKKKDVRTTTYESVSKNYSSKGLLSEKTLTNSTTKQKKDDDDNWQNDTYYSTSKTYNRDGILSSEEETSTTYGDKYAYNYNEKSYNTYTQQVTYEHDQKDRTNKDGDVESYNSYTYNNDNGTQRSRTVYDYDGTQTRYNSADTAVAKMDKDGTWKNGAGKVIGKNEYDEETGNSEYTEVEFADRTGEISGYTVKTTKYNDDGDCTEVKTEYDAAGQKTLERKVIDKAADNTHQLFVDGVLRHEINKDGDEITYDAKGKVYSTAKHDQETGETTVYDHAGKKDYMYNYNPKDGLAYGETYDGNEKVVSSWKEDEDGKTNYYNAKGKLTYSEKEYNEDGQSGTIYYGKDGKEFARTYYTDWKWADNERTYSQQDWYYDSHGIYPDLEDNEGTLQKYDYKYTSETKQGVTTTTDTYDYKKWEVTDGKKQNEVTRKEVTVTVSDKDHSESKTTKDGVVSSTTYSEKNGYGNTVKKTVRSYDWYDGKLTGVSKEIKSGVPDDPMSYSKSYDKYENLQSYQATDDTDEWDWSKSYYADGSQKGERWSGELYGDNNDYSVSYYHNGNKKAESFSKDGVSRSVSYNSDGTYRLWADTDAEGVTNTWIYNRYGTLTGYKWNEKKVEDSFEAYEEEYDYLPANNYTYSYEQWDANALLYTYNEQRMADGYSWSKVDPAGNKLAYNEEDGCTLTLANKATSGWQQAVGEWFYLENGQPVQSDWRLLGGSWFFFDWDGTMHTGLMPEYNETTDSITTYALDSNGALSAGGWTMLNEDGSSWAYTDASGVVITGWQLINGQWYYFDDGWYYDKPDYKADAGWEQSAYKGIMATGAQSIWNWTWTDKHTYFFNEDGTWDTSEGWKLATAEDLGREEYHYYDKNGVEAVGWKQIDGNWYYFNEDGVMKNGWVYSGGTWYYMDPMKQGAMAEGWVQEVYEDWYYMDKGGALKYGCWLQDGTNWYYLKDSGAMAANEFIKSGDATYYLSANGAMATGWVKDQGDWYYLDPTSGALKTSSWVLSGTTWYYMDADGAMVSDCELEIGGKTYAFDENGACTNP